MNKKLNENVGNGYPLDLNGETDMGNYKNGMNVKSLTGLPYYSYDIVPLNHELETKQNNISDFKNYLKIGNKIKGLVLNTKNEYQEGIIIKKIKNNEGTLLYYIIISSLNGKKYQIDPSKIKLIKFNLSDIFRQNNKNKKDIQYPSIYNFLKNK